MGYNDVDIVATSWTPEQQLAWRETYTPPLAGTSLVVCILAQVLFYIFPRLRAFPRSLLAWVNYYNIIFLIYLLLKWTRSSPLHSSWAAHIAPGSISCRFVIFLDIITLTGTTSCTTLICLTMFLVVVMHKDLEARKRYKWGYLAFAVLYPLCLSTLVAFAFGTGRKEGQSCTVTNEIGNEICRLPYLGFVAIQIILLVTTMVYIRRTVASVSHHVTKATPILYIFIRFIATFFAQLVNVFPAQTLLIFTETVNNAIFFRFVLVTHMLGCMLDALVLIFGNIEFLEWIKKQASRLRDYIQSTYQSNVHLSQNSEKKETEASGKKEQLENKNESEVMAEGAPTSVTVAIEEGESRESSSSGEGHCTVSCCRCFQLDFFVSFVGTCK